MIAWILTNWITQIAVLAFCVWFLNGLRKALWRPLITYVGHTKIDKDAYFVEVMRQELLPPWRTVKERWRVKPYYPARDWKADREIDGIDANRSLTIRLNNLTQLALDREKELANLTESKT